MNAWVFVRYGIIKNTILPVKQMLNFPEKRFCIRFLRDKSQFSHCIARPA